MGPVAGVVVLGPWADWIKPPTSNGRNFRLSRSLLITNNCYNRSPRASCPCHGHHPRLEGLFRESPLAVFRAVPWRSLRPQLQRDRPGLCIACTPTQASALVVRVAVDCRQWLVSESRWLVCAVVLLLLSSIWLLAAGTLFQTNVQVAVSDVGLKRDSSFASNIAPAMYDAGLPHPPSPPHPMVSTPRPTLWGGARGGALPRPAPVVSLLWWAVHPPPS